MSGAIERELCENLARSFTARQEVVVDWALKGCACGQRQLDDFEQHSVEFPHQVHAVLYLVYRAGPEWEEWRLKDLALVEEYGEDAADWQNPSDEDRHAAAMANLAAALLPRARVFGVDVEAATEAILAATDVNRMELAVRFVAQAAFLARRSR